MEAGGERREVDREGDRELIFSTESDKMERKEDTISSVYFAVE